MGRPYETELEQLPATYRWATEAPVDRFAAALRAASSLPLVAVGSGGSLTTAEFAAALHRELTGKLACAMTPMEAVSTGVDLRSAAVLMASAGGKNPDVLGSFRRFCLREPGRFVVLCTSIKTPLARLASAASAVDFIELDIPSGRDGFLATNSLLASVVLLARAYGEATRVDTSLPRSFADVLGVSSGGEGRAYFDSSFERLWEKDTLVVLHGSATRPAVVDLESKFTEAALGNVRAADYRHFAHGRHHWLAKHPKTSAVLALVTPDDKSIATQTLGLLPRGIPVVRVDLKHQGILGSIAGLAQVLHIAGSAARARGIDPGKPGVPTFGRKIYHLKAFPSHSARPIDDSSDETAAIERKTGRSLSVLAAQGQLVFWREAYCGFIRQLDQTTFGGVVLDYDGTICGEANRFDPLDRTIGGQLTRLLESGIPLGIATGRGKSVRVTLRKAIPKKHWGKVVVGYYNGGDIGMLSDDARPDGTEAVCEALRPVQAALAAHSVFGSIATSEPRLPQVSIHPKPGTAAEYVWEVLQEVVYSLEIPGVVVVCSSHSMDILAPGVSKKAVVERLSELSGSSQAPPILRIGDRGRWPGNDSALLCSAHALSVDEVSADPATCWNLAPPGHCGVQAALGYLANLRPYQKGVRLAPATKSRRRP